MKKQINRFLNREQSRTVDRIAIEEFGIPGVVLMENAGRGCAELLLRDGCKRNAVICCGPGNNGGDGYVIARHLEIRGIMTKVVMFCDPARLTGDALINYQIHRKSSENIVQLKAESNEAKVEQVLGEVDGAPAEVIVDCLLGTGSKGSPRNPLDVAIRVGNRMPARRVAVDVPSGLDCDTGHIGEPTFMADMTCTFVAAKIGFQNEFAQKCLGKVEIVEIGIPKCVLRQVLNTRI